MALCCAPQPVPELFLCSVDSDVNGCQIAGLVTLVRDQPTAGGGVDGLLVVLMLMCDQCTGCSENFFISLSHLKHWATFKTIFL